MVQVGDSLLDGHPGAFIHHPGQGINGFPERGVASGGTGRSRLGESLVLFAQQAPDFGDEVRRDPGGHDGHSGLVCPLLGTVADRDGPETGIEKEPLPVYVVSSLRNGGEEAMSMEAPPMLPQLLQKIETPAHLHLYDPDLGPPQGHQIGDDAVHFDLLVDVEAHALQVVHHQCGGFLLGSDEGMFHGRFPGMVLDINGRMDVMDLGNRPGRAY